MRAHLVLSLALVAATALADNATVQRLVTPDEADAIYLSILNSQSYEESASMLTDVGVEPTAARELLDYLAAEFQGHEHVGSENAARLCRNENDQFSNPLGLADEIKRRNAEERQFQASMVRQAKKILNVNSLRPIWQPHMDDPGIVDNVDVVEWILDGRLKPADAIARACRVAEQEDSRFTKKRDST